MYFDRNLRIGMIQGATGMYREGMYTGIMR